MTLRSSKNPAAAREPLAAKVPEITAMFWVLKLLSTGIGEAISDALGQKSVPLAAVVGVFGTLLAFSLQFRTRAYNAVAYWFAVLMVAVFGTMVADGIHDGAGIGYDITTPVFAAIVALIFWRWHRSEGTLSIHSIATRRRERYYWGAVLATFALGTAAGDLTAYFLGWGFFPSAALFAALMCIPALLWKRNLVNPILGFWTAYVLTRPLGASFADGFSKPTNGGLKMGDPTVALIGLAVFVVLVAYVAATKRDIQDPAAYPEVAPARRVSEHGQGHGEALQPVTAVD